MMPPPDSHRELKPEQKETLKRWIEQGAAYAKHWSFIPPVKADAAGSLRQELGRATKSTASSSRASTPKDLQPSPRSRPPHAHPPPLASTSPACRRRPRKSKRSSPTKSPDAYEKLVDRLLASPHFGERMALVWLDAARYADTNGYSIDGGRHMWLWRDWVIDAFNRNLPYDQFLREQLAGDLLPNRTEAQLIATGFQRNNMNTHEGGTIPEENLTNYNVDRVKTLGEAVLGLTLGCAQCHDHKFDPHHAARLLPDLRLLQHAQRRRPRRQRAASTRGRSIEAKTVLQTGEEPELRQQIEALKEKLAQPVRRRRRALGRRATLAA